MANNRSLKGLQVAFGILGTIAAVVVVFAYAVSGDLYIDEHSDLSQQSSTQFSSTVSGRDIPEATDVTLPASSKPDPSLDSPDRSAASTQPVADIKQPASKPANSDSSVATSPNDDGKLTDQIKTPSIPNIAAQSNNAGVEEVPNENNDNENNQLVDRQEHSIAKIENIATTIQSDNRDDGKDSTNHEDGGEEKKEHDDHHKHDHKSGKGDGHKHKDKEKGKGHHID